MCLGRFYVGAGGMESRAPEDLEEVYQFLRERAGDAEGTQIPSGWDWAETEMGEERIFLFYVFNFLYFEL